MIDKRYTKVHTFTNSRVGIGRYFEIQRSNFPFHWLKINYTPLVTSTRTSKPMALHDFLLRNDLTAAL